MKEKQRHIWVIRHGDRADGCQASQSSYARSSVYDPPLTIAGLRQAKMTAKYICSKNNKSSEPPTLVMTSPFLRCVQTAWPLAVAAKAPLVIENSLCEWLTSALFPPHSSVVRQHSSAYNRSSPLGPLLTLAELQEVVRESYGDGDGDTKPLLVDSAALAPRLLTSLPAFDEHILSVEARCRLISQWLSSSSSSSTSAPTTLKDNVAIVTHGYSCAFLCSELLHPGNAREFLGVSVPECSVSHFVSNKPTTPTPTEADTTEAPPLIVVPPSSVVVQWNQETLFSTGHLPAMDRYLPTLTL